MMSRIYWLCVVFVCSCALCASCSPINGTTHSLKIELSLVKQKNKVCLSDKNIQLKITNYSDRNILLGSYVFETQNWLSRLAHNKRRIQLFYTTPPPPPMDFSEDNIFIFPPKKDMCIRFSLGMESNDKFNEPFYVVQCFLSGAFGSSYITTPPPNYLKLWSGSLKSNILKINLDRGEIEETIIDNTLPVLDIIHLLKNEKWQIRSRAARALGETGDKSAVQPLIVALQDPDPDVRQSSVIALGDIGDRRAITALIKTLKDSDCLVRKQSVIVLGRMADKTTIPMLINVLQNDRSIDVCMAAACALGKIGKPALSEINNLFNSKKEWDRMLAITALDAIEKNRTLTMYTNALDDPSYLVRWAAIKSISNFIDKSAVQILVVALNDESGWVRWRAAKGLGTLIFLFPEEKKTAIPALIGALSDEIRWVRENSARSLKKIIGLSFGTDAAKWREWWEKNKTRILKEEAAEEK